MKLRDALLVVRFHAEHIEDDPRETVDVGSLAADLGQVAEAVANFGDDDRSQPAAMDAAARLSARAMLLAMRHAKKSQPPGGGGSGDPARLSDAMEKALDAHAEMDHIWLNRDPQNSLMHRNEMQAAFSKMETAMERLSSEVASIQKHGSSGDEIERALLAWGQYALCTWINLRNGWQQAAMNHAAYDSMISSVMRELRSDMQCLCNAFQNWKNASGQQGVSSAPGSV